MSISSASVMCWNQGSCVDVLARMDDSMRNRGWFLAVDLFAGRDEMGRRVGTPALFTQSQDLPHASLPEGQIRMARCRNLGVQQFLDVQEHAGDAAIRPDDGTPATEA